MLSCPHGEAITTLLLSWLSIGLHHCQCGVATECQERKPCFADIKRCHAVTLESLLQSASLHAHLLRSPRLQTSATLLSS